MVEFDYMYKTHYNYVRSIVYKLINDDPEDIIQMTFLKLSQSSYALNEENLARSFLKKVATNLSLSYLKTKNNRLKREYAWHTQQYDNKNEEAITELDKEVELATIYNDVIAFIHKQIKALPTGMRNVFELYYFKDKNTIEIATELNITPHTVCSQLSNARKILKIEILFNKKSVLQLLTKRPTL